MVEDITSFAPTQASNANLQNQVEKLTRELFRELSKDWEKGLAKTVEQLVNQALGQVIGSGGSGNAILDVLTGTTRGQTITPDSRGGLGYSDSQIAVQLADLLTRAQRDL